MPTANQKCDRLIGTIVATVLVLCILVPCALMLIGAHYYPASMNDYAIGVQNLATVEPGDILKMDKGYVYVSGVMAPGRYATRVTLLREHLLDSLRISTRSRMFGGEVATHKYEDLAPQVADIIHTWEPRYEYVFERFRAQSLPFGYYGP